MTRREAFLCTFGLTGGWLRSQESASAASVEVNVIVRSISGELVRDLGIGDFTVIDSGKPQTIRALTREEDAPLTLGLLMDTNASSRRMPERERQVAYDFLERIVRAPKNTAFVIQYGASVSLRQYLTSSRQSLEAALRPESLNFPPRLQPPSGTKLYDAVVQAVQQCMQFRRGRKVCIVLSSWIDTDSQATLADAIEAAQRTDTQVYLVLFSRAKSFMFPRPATARTLDRLSAETGGGYFEISERQPIERVFAQIEQELRASFTLTYTPDPVDSGYRTVRVGVKRNNQVVQAREGYYSAIDVPSAQPQLLRIVQVEPMGVNTGDVVTASGDGLDQSNIAAVYLTDGPRTLQVEMLEQNATSIRFKVPAEADPGPWLHGEARPHKWTILLRAPAGDFLQYVGFQIAVE